MGIKNWVMIAAIALLLCGCSSSKNISLSKEEKALAAAIGFDEKVLVIAKSISPDLQRLQGYTDMGDGFEAEGVTVKVPSAKAGKIQAKLRKLLLPLGYTAYLNEVHFGYAPDVIAILKSGDPFALVRIRGTNGINYDIAHKDVMARLRQWDKKYGLKLIGADMDWVEAEFTHPPTDMLAFAKEVYLFCSDVVDQGTGSVEALAAEMSKTNRVYLWWD